MSILKKFSNKLNSSTHKKRDYFLVYTLLFLITSLLVFIYLLLTKKTLIWRQDGWNQHFKTLVYYGQYLRQIAKNFLHFNFTIPSFDFSIGEGSDILQTLHFYVIGDPFSALSIFVPTRFMHYFYSLFCVLRIYLAGIAFSLLCFKFKVSSRSGILLGALSYSFCTWALINCARHPFFLNPLIFFPLIIIGLEKIINKESPILYIVVLALSAMSNFYFFYITALCTFIYAITRIIFVYRKDAKTIVGKVLLIGVYTIVGILISSVIFVPVCNAFLADSRNVVTHTINLIYPLNYYANIPVSFTSTKYTFWLTLGLSVPTLFSLITLFLSKKKHTLIKLFLIISLILLLFPIFGRIFNGMSYVSNRWSYALALLLSYILASTFEDVTALSKKSRYILLLVLIIYFCVSYMFGETEMTNMISTLSLSIIFFICIVILPNTKSIPKYLTSALAILITIASISMFSVSFFVSSDNDGYSKELIKYSDVSKGLNNDQASNIKKIAKEKNVKDFYRYSGNDLNTNAGIVKNMSSTDFFYSISNPNISDFITDLELSNYTLYHYENFDDRTALTTLDSVLYYAVPKDKEKTVPYGFEHVKDTKIKNLTNKETQNYDCSFYKNKYALPLGYTYKNYVDNKTFDLLSAIDKEQSMIQSVYIENYQGTQESSTPEKTSTSLEYSITANSDDVVVKDNSIITTKKNQEVTIAFSGIKNSETYVVFDNLDYEPTVKYDLYFGDDRFDPNDKYKEKKYSKLELKEQEKFKKDKLLGKYPSSTKLTFNTENEIEKVFTFLTPEHEYYNGRHNFSICLDYSKEPISYATIKFEKIGIYSFNKLDIISQDFSNYEDEINSLKEDVLENVKFDTDKVSGTINLDEDKFLTLSIPYSDGWKAYVDGEETLLYKANVKNVAIELSKGEHQIELRYTRALGLISVILSLSGLFVLIVLIFVNRKRK